MADATEELVDLTALRGAGEQDDGAEALLLEEGGEDEVLISFDGEGAPAQGEGQDSSLVRHLRDQLREQQRENRELKRQAPGVEKIEVGEKPTLQSVDYDEERYDRELDAWKERDARSKTIEQEAARTQQAQQEAWNKRLGELAVKKTALGVKDYDQAAAEVDKTLSLPQQQMLIRAAVDPAKMIYVLGKSPAKAAELAAITDPIDFIATIARLEGKTTMTTQRKGAPPPEQTVRGSAPLSRSVDKEEKRLEAEALKSKDRTELIRYRKQKRDAQARR